MWDLDEVLKLCFNLDSDFGYTKKQLQSLWIEVIVASFDQTLIKRHLVDSKQMLDQAQYESHMLGYLLH